MDVHHIRNGLVGIYAERKRLLAAMLDVADMLASKERKKLPQACLHRLSTNLIEQIGCIRRMDEQLSRVLLHSKSNKGE